VKRNAALALSFLGALLLAPAAAAQDQAPFEPAPIVAPAHVNDDAAPAAAPGPNALEDTLRDLAPPIRLAIILTALVFIPSLLLTVTSYTRIIIVLSFIRRAIGAPELPPNPILVGLSLFLTAAVMAPTFARVNETALAPFLDETKSMTEAGSAACAELKTFMMRQTREEDLALALKISRAERPAGPEDTPMAVAVPAFVLSELRTAFRMGFLVFLPFVLIDLVVASVLLALGMFMLPPTMIAMPLKILLFVLVDGWSLVIQSLAVSFA
jgi:flagellar biosynthetic protein FliP